MISALGTLSSVAWEQWPGVNMHHWIVLLFRISVVWSEWCCCSAVCSWDQKGKVFCWADLIVPSCAACAERQQHNHIQSMHISLQTNMNTAQYHSHHFCLFLPTMIQKSHWCWYINMNMSNKMSFTRGLGSAEEGSCADEEPQYFPLSDVSY